MVGSAAALMAYFIDRVSVELGTSWLIAAIILLAILPFTSLFLNETSNLLLDSNYSLKKGELWIRQGIDYWWRMNFIRFGMGMVSFIIFICNVMSR